MRNNIIIFLLFLSPCISFAQKKNVIVILLDDLGVETVTADSIEISDGTRYNVTLDWMQDSLGNKGVYFPNAYATPICTPSRIAQLTGRYNYKSYHGFETIHKDDRTTAHNAAWDGYNTAIVGKWQLGANTIFQQVSKSAVIDTLPRRLGFDRWMCFNYIDNSTRNRYAQPSYNIDGTLTAYGANDYGPDVELDTVKALISRWKDSVNPFYIQWMWALPHTSFEPPSTHPDFPNQLAGVGDDQYFPSMLDYMDDLLETFYNHLDSIGILDETIVIITADNGTPDEPTSPQRLISIQNNGTELSARKTWNDYRGTHVPMWILYDGVDKAFTNGDTISRLVQLEDIYATIAELTGNAEKDGVSLMGQISNSYTAKTRNYVVNWYNTYIPSWNIFSRNGISLNKTVVHNGVYAYVKEDDEFFDMVNDQEFTTPIAKPGGGIGDAIISEAANHPASTFIYPSVMKVLLNNEN